MKTKISILLLDELESHFEKMQQIISQIIKDKCEMEANFIYTYDENKQITKYEDGSGYFHKSIYGASANVKSSNLNKLSGLLQKIQSPQNVIAVIDINWDDRNESNRYGRNFYEDHLKNKILPTNTIFVSFIEETNLGQDLTLGFQFVPKKRIDKNGNVEWLGDIFKKEMEDALCRTAVLSGGIEEEESNEGLGNNI